MLTLLLLLLAFVLFVASALQKRSLASAGLAAWVLAVILGSTPVR